VLLFVAILAFGAALPTGVLLAVGFVLAVAIEVLRRVGLGDVGALLLAWAPVHLLVLGTGALASPVLPLAGAWVVAVGLAWRRASPWAAAGATLLLLGSVPLFDAAPLMTEDVLRLLLLVGLAAVLPAFVPASAPPASTPPAERTGSRTPAHEPPALPFSNGAKSQVLDLVRHATAAREAALWRIDSAANTFEIVGSASGAVSDAPPAQIASATQHPYFWAIEERQPVHLQKGRKPLPREFAAEMLLVPVGDEGGLLTLAYDAPVPVHAGEAALACAQLLADLTRRPPAREPTFEANLDSLTELPDAATFEGHLEEACSRFRTESRPFSVVLLDIDHFKRLNDEWGHDAGDRVLQHVASLLRGATRDGDLVARLGGEEFALLLPDTGLGQAVALAERSRRALETTALRWNGRHLAATASFGVASCPESCTQPFEARTEAQSELFAAKRAGRNRVSAAALRG
jgi:diguanylate cyclase (GGDEF)-like protein